MKAQHSTAVTNFEYHSFSRYRTLQFHGSRLTMKVDYHHHLLLGKVFCTWLISDSSSMLKEIKLLKHLKEDERKNEGSVRNFVWSWILINLIYSYSTYNSFSSKVDRCYINIEISLTRESAKEMHKYFYILKSLIDMILIKLNFVKNFHKKCSPDT